MRVKRYRWLVVGLLLMCTGCWRTSAGPIKVEFKDGLSVQMQDAAKTELNGISSRLGYVFIYDGQGSNHLYIHGRFPARDDWPSNCYVDHATINGETWRADVYVRELAGVSDLQWGLNTAMNY